MRYLNKKCDICHSSPATQMTIIEFNGVRYEVAICEQCLQSRQIKVSPYTFIGGEPECPVCHTRLSDIVDSEYVGCSECYNVFRGQILGNIQNMHGTRKHQGKRLRAGRQTKKINLSDKESMKEMYLLAIAEGRTEDAEEILSIMKGGEDE